MYAIRSYYAEVNGKELTLTGLVASVDGTQVIRQSVTCPLEEGSEKAIELADSILERGGKRILDQIRAL